MFYTKPAGIQQLSHPLLNHVNGLYLFNDYQSGTVMDYSGKGNHFKFPSSNRPSWRGEGLEFNGDYERVDSEFEGLDIITQECTIIFRYKVTVVESFHYLLSPISGFTAFSVIFLPDFLTMQVYLSGLHVLSTVAINDGNWHIFAVKWTSTRLGYWTQGYSVEDSTTTILPGSISTLGLGGRRDATDRSSGGIIDWVMFLNYYLEDAELDLLVDENLPYKFFKVNNDYGYVSAVGPSGQLLTHPGMSGIGNYQFNNNMNGGFNA